jgi:hypothetical protein
MLENERSMDISEKKVGMVSIAPDFDEDPESVASKYKSQLDQLNSRITLLENEKDSIEKVYSIHLGKKSKNESIPVRHANFA